MTGHLSPCQSCIAGRNASCTFLSYSPVFSLPGARHRDVFRGRGLFLDSFSALQCDTWQRIGYTWQSFSGSRALLLKNSRADFRVQRNGIIQNSSTGRGTGRVQRGAGVQGSRRIQQEVSVGRGSESRRGELKEPQRGRNSENGGRYQGPRRTDGGRGTGGSFSKVEGPPREFDGDSDGTDSDSEGGSELSLGSVNAKDLPAGMRTMKDPETGELVIVWGPDDGAPWITPSPEDLKFEEVEIIGSGDMSDEELWERMEGDKLLPSGGYSAKGQRISGEGGEDEDDEDEDDFLGEMEGMDEGELQKLLADLGEGYESEEVDESEEVGTESGREERGSVGKVPIGGGEATGDHVSSADMERSNVTGSLPPVSPVSTSSPSPTSRLSPSPPPPPPPPPPPTTTPIVAGMLDGGATVPKGSREGRKERGGEGEKIRKNYNSSTSSEVLEVGGSVTKEEEEEEEEEEEAGWERRSREREAESPVAPLKNSLVAESSSVRDRQRRGEWEEERDFSVSSVPAFEGIIDLDDEEEVSGRNAKAQKSGREGGASGKEFLESLRRKALGLEKMSEDGQRGENERRFGEKTTEVSSREGETIEDLDDLSHTSRKGESIIGRDETREPSKKTKVAMIHEERSNFDASLVDEFLSVKTFRQIGANEGAINALSSMGIGRPSHIQAMSYKPVLNARDCLIADQTGTGKTLAYLSPIMQRLKEEETDGGGRAQPYLPLALILVPTAELAAQVLRVCRQLSDGGLRLRSQAVTGGYTWRTQVEGLANGAEIVVATPGRLLQHVEAGSVKLSSVKSVVVDEADILFDDEGFAEALEPIRSGVTAGKTQFIHVSATLPVEVHDALLSIYPGAISLIGPSLHKTAAGLQEILVDCSGGERSPEVAFERKKEALLKIVKQKPASKSIVFCNKIETCRKVENALQRLDRQGKSFEVLPYHGALTQDARQASMTRFLKQNPSKRLILVCTDRASRGVDSLDVDQVILFDFPRDPSEYVRRVGRTARGAGGTGSVYALAIGKQVSLAREIMARNDRGQPIRSIPGPQY